MPEFTAQDVKRLRDATGAGMMDAKRALTECEGDFDLGVKWLREKGLAQSQKRSDRENTQGAVALATAGNVAAIVELKCETDFVAKSDEFVELADRLAELVATKGEDAVAERRTDIDDLKIKLKENIELGRVARIEASDGAIIDTYLHKQGGRGVNAVVVELSGGSRELAHDVAVSVAFNQPSYLRREDVPDSELEAERSVIESKARNEGKPEAALPKIIDGMLTGWYKQIVLLDQPFAKDDKKSISQALGDATVTRYAQVVIAS